MRAMSNSGEPASSGAATSSFAHIGANPFEADVDGDQALILDGADGEAEHLQGQYRQGEVRVQGQQEHEQVDVKKLKYFQALGSSSISQAPYPVPYLG